MRAHQSHDDLKEQPYRLRVREVPVTELRRRAAAVIEGVVAGEAAVISKHGRPVAVVLPLGAGEKQLQHEVSPAELRELERLFRRRAARRRSSELMHGRWWNGGGIHGAYR
jgi:prevent-host-death family protein